MYRRGVSMCFKQISGGREGGGEKENTPFHDFFQLLTMTRAQLLEGRLALQK